MPTNLSLRQTRRTLVALAVLSEFVYYWDFVRPFPLLQYYDIDIDMGAITSHATLGFVSFVSALVALYVLFVLAWRNVRDVNDSRSLVLVLGTGAVFGVTMSFVYPVTAIDIFTYIDQSWIMVHYHQNPIFTPPLAHAGNPVMHLSGEWGHSGAPYGPLGIVIDAIPTLLTGTTLLSNLLALKLMFSAVTLADAYLAYLILRRLSPRHALGGAIVIAWNPLVIFETSANGHNDVVMLLFVLLGLYCLADGSFILGTVLVAASGLVKYGTLVLLPLVLVHCVTHLPEMRPRVRYVALVSAILLLMIAAAYAPFWRGFDTFSRSLSENNLYVASFSSVLPGLIPAISTAAATTLGRVLFVPIYGLALILARRDLSNLIRGCFLATFAFLGLSITNFKSWYAIWPTVFAASSPDVSIRLAAVIFGFCVSVSVPLYGYVWVWLGVSPRTFTGVNTAAYLLDFLPAGLALTLGLIWRPATAGIDRWLGARGEIAEPAPPG